MQDPDDQRPKSDAPDAEGGKAVPAPGPAPSAIPSLFAARPKPATPAEPEPARPAPAAPAPMTAQSAPAPAEPAPAPAEPAPAPTEPAPAAAPSASAPTEPAPAPTEPAPAAPGPDLTEPLTPRLIPGARKPEPFPGLTVLANALGLLLAIGASVGVAIWQWMLGPQFQTLVTANAVGRPARVAGFKTTAVTIVVVAVLAAGLSLLLRRHAHPVRTLARLARRAAPLSLLALLPPLLHWQSWQYDRDLPFLFLAVTLVLGAHALLRHAFSGEPVLAGWQPPASWTRFRTAAATLVRRSSRWLPFTLVVVAALYYAIFFAYVTIVHHRNLLSTSMDLGLEDNLVWNALHGALPVLKSSPHCGINCTHLGNHATWFAFLIAPIYAIRQNAETLLAFQATLIGCAAIPLYLVARRHLAPWLSCLVALLYVFYPPVHGPNLYDFHYPVLAPFFIWFTLYFFEGRRWLLGWVFGAITLTIREDISAALIVIGGYMILVPSQDRPTGSPPAGTDWRARMGVLVATAGAIYFVVMKMVIMPRALGGGESFVDGLYGGLLPAGEHTYGAILKTVFTNLPFTLETTLVTRDKLVYMLLLFVPLAFFPLRRPIALLCCVPGFFFTLLSTGYRPLYQISFQYTAHWTSYLFIALILNLAWLQRSTTAEGKPGTARRRAWIGAIIVAMFVTSHQFGGLMQQNTVKGGFGPYHFGTNADDLRRRRDVAPLLKMIPPRAKIVASENLVPQVSSRPDAYTLRVGVFDADYLLFSVPPWADERSHVLEVLQPGTFGVVQVSGDYVLARRGHPTDANAGVLARMGVW